MRQQRHTTAYARSWQPSGDTAALHRYSSEINASHKKAPATCPGLSSSYRETPTLANGSCC